MSSTIEKTHRIGFLSNDRLDFGGVETHLRMIFQSLQGTEFRPVLIAPVSARFQQAVRELGIECIEWRLPDKRGFTGLVSILRANRISLLHIHSPGAAIVGRLAAFVVGIPAIVTVHLHPRDYFSGWIKKIIFYCLNTVLNYTITQKVIYVSRRDHANDIQLKSLPSKKAVVIPNSVFLPQLHSRPYSGRLILCFVGRLEPQKGLDGLLKAISLLESPRSVELWLVGAGSAQSDLEKLARVLGLHDNVRFFGYQEDPGYYLSAADIFVLPSRFEGMPIALLEAMSYGLPCIVTDVGENRSLINHGINGFVCPPGNTQTLSHYLAVLIGNQFLRNQMHTATLAIIKSYNFEKIKNTLVSVYRDSIKI